MFRRFWIEIPKYGLCSRFLTHRRAKSRLDRSFFSIFKNITLIFLAVRHYRMVRVCQNRQTRTQMQYIIFQHSTTLVLLTAAEYIALYTKVDPNIDITNSESLLNWLGIVTIILYFIQVGIQFVFISHTLTYYIGLRSYFITILFPSFFKKKKIIQIISGFFIYLYPRWFTVHNNTVQSVHTSMGIVSFVFVIGIAVFGFSQEFLNAL